VFGLLGVFTLEGLDSARRDAGLCMVYVLCVDAVVPFVEKLNHVSHSLQIKFFNVDGPRGGLLRLQ
jgi:hypothetical protein